MSSGRSRKVFSAANPALPAPIIATDFSAVRVNGTGKASGAGQKKDGSNNDKVRGNCCRFTMVKAKVEDRTHY